MSSSFRFELDKILKNLDRIRAEANENGRNVTAEFIRRIKMMPAHPRVRLTRVLDKTERILCDYRELIIEHEKVQEENKKLRVLLHQRENVVFKLKEFVNTLGRAPAGDNIPMSVVVNLLEIALEGVVSLPDEDIDKVEISKAEMEKFMDPIERRLKNVMDNNV
jgi:hypothetical protein